MVLHFLKVICVNCRRQDNDRAIFQVRDVGLFGGDEVLITENLPVYVCVCVSACVVRAKAEDRMTSSRPIC